MKIIGIFFVFCMFLVDSFGISVMPYNPVVSLGGYYSSSHQSAEAKASFLFPMASFSKDLLLTDFIVNSYFNNVELNTGLGYRRYNTTHTWLYGVYSMFDYLFINEKLDSKDLLSTNLSVRNYMQATIGGETWIYNYYMAMNGYIPLGQKEYNAQEVFLKQEDKYYSNILIQNNTYSALLGGDIRFGWNGIKKLGIYVRGYTFGFTKGVNNLYGGNVKVVWDIYNFQKSYNHQWLPLVTLDVRPGWDTYNQLYIVTGIKLSLDFNHHKFTGVQRHLLDPIHRDLDVVTEKVTKDEAKALQLHGHPIRIYMVNDEDQLNLAKEHTDADAIGINGTINVTKKTDDPVIMGRNVTMTGKYFLFTDDDGQAHKLDITSSQGVIDYTQCSSCSMFSSKDPQNIIIRDLHFIGDINIFGGEESDTKVEPNVLFELNNIYIKGNLNYAGGSMQVTNWTSNLVNVSVDGQLNYVSGSMQVTNWTSKLVNVSVDGNLNYVSGSMKATNWTSNLVNVSVDGQLNYASGSMQVTNWTSNLLNVSVDGQLNLYADKYMKVTNWTTNLVNVSVDGQLNLMGYNSQISNIVFNVNNMVVNGSFKMYDGLSSGTQLDTFQATISNSTVNGTFEFAVPNVKTSSNILIDNLRVVGVMPDWSPYSSLGPKQTVEIRNSYFKTSSIGFYHMDGNWTFDHNTFIIQNGSSNSSKGTTSYSGLTFSFVNNAKITFINNKVMIEPSPSGLDGVTFYASYRNPPMGASIDFENNIIDTSKETNFDRGSNIIHAFRMSLVEKNKTSLKFVHNTLKGNVDIWVSNMADSNLHITAFDDNTIDVLHRALPGRNASYSAPISLSSNGVGLYNNFNQLQVDSMKGNTFLNYAAGYLFAVGGQYAHLNTQNAFHITIDTNVAGTPQQAFAAVNHGAAFSDDNHIDLKK